MYPSLFCTRLMHDRLKVVICSALIHQGMKWAIRSLRLFMTTRHGAEASNELFHNIQVGAWVHTSPSLPPCKMANFPGRMPS
jgi:hypothetical protein